MAGILRSLVYPWSKLWSPLILIIMGKRLIIKHIMYNTWTLRIITQ